MTGTFFNCFSCEDLVFVIVCLPEDFFPHSHQLLTGIISVPDFLGVSAIVGIFINPRMSKPHLQMCSSCQTAHLFLAHMISPSLPSSTCKSLHPKSTRMPCCSCHRIPSFKTDMDSFADSEALTEALQSGLPSNSTLVVRGEKWKGQLARDYSWIIYT